jgi:hypothetical protein
MLSQLLLLLPSSSSASSSSPAMEHPTSGPSRGVAILVGVAAALPLALCAESLVGWLHRPAAAWLRAEHASVRALQAELAAQNEGRKQMPSTLRSPTSTSRSSRSTQGRPGVKLPVIAKLPEQEQQAEDGDHGHEASSLGRHPWGGGGSTKGQPLGWRPLRSPGQATAVHMTLLALSAGPLLLVCGWLLSRAPAGRADEPELLVPLAEELLRRSGWAAALYLGPLDMLIALLCAPALREPPCGLISSQKPAAASEHYAAHSSSSTATWPSPTSPADSQTAGPADIDSASTAVMADHDEEVDDDDDDVSALPSSLFVWQMDKAKGSFRVVPSTHSMRSSSSFSEGGSARASSQRHRSSSRSSSQRQRPPPPRAVSFAGSALQQPQRRRQRGQAGRLASASMGPSLRASVTAAEDEDESPPDEEEAAAADARHRRRGRAAALLRPSASMREGRQQTTAVTRSSFDPLAMALDAVNAGASFKWMRDEHGSWRASQLDDQDFDHAIAVKEAQRLGNKQAAAAAAAAGRGDRSWRRRPRSKEAQVRSTLPNARGGKRQQRRQEEQEEQEQEEGSEGSAVSGQVDGGDSESEPEPAPPLSLGGGDGGRAVSFAAVAEAEEAEEAEAEEAEAVAEAEEEESAAKQPASQRRRAAGLAGEGRQLRAGSFLQRSGEKGKARWRLRAPEDEEDRNDLAGTALAPQPQRQPPPPDNSEGSSDYEYYTTSDDDEGAAQ